MAVENDRPEQKIEAKNYTFSLVMSLADLLKGEKEGEFRDAALNKEYQVAAELARFLADPNFAQEMQQAGIDASQFINPILEKYGFLETEVQSPFEQNYVVPSEGEPGENSSKDVRKETPDEKSEGEMSQTLSLQFAAIAQNENGEFAYSKDELPYLTLSDEDKGNPDAKKSAYALWIYAKKSLADKIQFMVEKSPEGSTMAQVVKNNLGSINEKNRQRLFEDISSQYGDFSPEEFIDLVLKRKTRQS